MTLETNILIEWIITASIELDFQSKSIDLDKFSKPLMFRQTTNFFEQDAPYSGCVKLHLLHNPARIGKNPMAVTQRKYMM